MLMFDKFGVNRGLYSVGRELSPYVGRSALRMSRVPCLAPRGSDQDAVGEPRRNATHRVLTSLLGTFRADSHPFPYPAAITGSIRFESLFSILRTYGLTGQHVISSDG